MLCSFSPRSEVRGEMCRVLPLGQEGPIKDFFLFYLSFLPRVSSQWKMLKNCVCLVSSGGGGGGEGEGFPTRGRFL